MALMTQVGLEFIAKNRAQAQMSGFERSLSRMGRQMLAMAGLGGGLYAIKRGFDFATKAAKEQETAEKALIAAVGDSIGQFKQYASELQRLTIYGDEQILSQMAYAANLGVTKDKLNEAARAAIGLAARFRIDLSSAMMLVGRASQGQTQLLTRYGIVIDQNLDDQEKFNELLRIGADSFHLAEAAAQDTEGRMAQFHNAMSDIAEVVGGPVLDALKDFSGWVVENKDDIQGFIEGQVQGWEDIAHAIEYARDMGKSITEKTTAGKAQGQRWGFTYGLPGFQPGQPMLPEGRLEISPRGYQRLEEMRAYERRVKEITDLTRDFMSAEFTASQKARTLTAEQKKLADIGDKYIGILDKEIALTGRVGEAHWHAAKAIEMQQEIQKAGLEGTEYAIELTRKLEQKFKDLEKAQQLARIADDIGDAFATAFENAVMEGEKLRDVLNALTRDIARSILRNLVTQPIAMGISGAIGGLFGIEPVMGEKQFGGGIPRTGLYRMHAGERVIPAGGGGLPAVYIDNKSGIPLRQAGPAVYDGERIIVEIETSLADRINRYQGPLAPMFKK